MNLMVSPSELDAEVGRRSLAQSEAQLLLESLLPAVRLCDLVLGRGRNPYVRKALRRELLACQGVISRERFRSMSDLLDELDGRG